MITIAHQYIYAVCGDLSLGDSKAVLKQIQSILQAWFAVPQLIRVLQSPATGVSAKKEIIATLLAGCKRNTPNADRIIAFFTLFIINGRLSKTVITVIDEALDELNGVTRLVITTATPVSGPKKTALINCAKKVLQLQTRPEATFNEDPSLLAGFRILIKNRLIDGSLQRNLTALKTKLYT